MRGIFRLKAYDCFNPESIQARFREYCALIEEDLETTPFKSGVADVKCMDARGRATYEQKCVSIWVTSPPYLNSFDYSDIYRPELFLAGYVVNNRRLMIRLQLRFHVQTD